MYDDILGNGTIITETKPEPAPVSEICKGKDCDCNKAVDEEDDDEWSVDEEDECDGCDECAGC